MQDTLYRLVYVSRNLIAEDGEKLREEIAGILACSRRNNVQVEVTGALMLNKGCFAQVLEGPHDAVQETFERIQCDERHSHVSVLAFDATETADFPTGRWLMWARMILRSMNSQASPRNPASIGKLWQASRFTRYCMHI